MENDFFPDIVSLRRRSKILMLVLAFSVMTNLLFLMYAFVQKVEAEKHAKIADQNHQIALKYHHELKAEIDSLKKSCK